MGGGKGLDVSGAGGREREDTYMPAGLRARGGQEADKEGDKQCV